MRTCLKTTTVTAKKEEKNNRRGDIVGKFERFWHQKVTVNSCIVVLREKLLNS